MKVSPDTVYSGSHKIQTPNHGGFSHAYGAVNALKNLESIHPSGTDSAGLARAVDGADIGQCVSQRAAARTPGLRSAADSRRRLHMDPRLLGMGRRYPRLLLGPGNLGARAATGVSLDPR